MGCLVDCLGCGARMDRCRPTTLFCLSCNARRGRERGTAQRRVRSAIVRGAIQPVAHCQCADCGAPADRYDHRDYTQPTAVDPVCASCNQRRGPALDSLMRSLPAPAPNGWPMNPTFKRPVRTVHTSSVAEAAHG